ncbi:MAG: hypothetical protein M3R17_18145 [Bacteroidota bacterium]|nr:hypothetical protein [Bacteroidota bacterium]
MNRLKVLLVKLTIPFIVLVCTWHSANIHWGKHWHPIIASDGKGYYSYLPAVFIYHDLNFSFFDTIENKYYDSHLKYDYRSMGNGKIINKYFCGVSVLQLPFFLGGHAAAKISGAEMDGYSKPYAIALNIGAIFWLMIGLIYMRKLLLAFGADRLKASLVILTFVFGTNLFFYTIGEPAMSHVYSFALVTLFFVYSKKWIDNSQNKYLLLTFLLLGIIAVVRPVNLLIILWIPFAAGSLPATFGLIKKTIAKPLCLIAALLFFILPVFIQLVIYKISTGHFFVYAYGIEKFNFGNPEIINFLFSYKKGLFIYTPLTFLSLFGLIPLWKQNRFRALWIFCSLLLIVYVLSCWWMWFYGGSFGMRAMIEFFPIFALLFYFLIDAIKIKTLRWGIIAITLLVVILCQFQTLQYRYEVIHWSDMDKESYWNTFLNIDFLRKKFH